MQPRGVLDRSLAYHPMDEGRQPASPRPQAPLTDEPPCPSPRSPLYARPSGGCVQVPVAA